MTTRYHAMRRCYEPASVKLIIVAESPPHSGKYFYDPKGSHTEEPLFREMMRQIEVSCSSKDEGLREFQKRGWILVDATYEQVDKGYSKAQRDQVIKRDYHLLRDELTKLTPDRSTPVILIKANVCRLLEAPLMKDKFKVLNDGVRPPFPGHWGVRKFRETFGALLPDGKPEG